MIFGFWNKISVVFFFLIVSFHLTYLSGNGVVLLQIRCNCSRCWTGRQVRNRPQKTGRAGAQWLCQGSEGQFFRDRASRWVLQLTCLSVCLKGLAILSDGKCRVEGCSLKAESGLSVLLRTEFLGLLLCCLLSTSLDEENLNIHQWH